MVPSAAVASGASTMSPVWRGPAAGAAWHPARAAAHKAPAKTRGNAAIRILRGWRGAAGKAEFSTGLRPELPTTNRQLPRNPADTEPTRLGVGSWKLGVAG